MVSKPLTKLNNWLSCLSVSIVLLLSLLVPLTLIHPQAAHAVTLPAYRYTKTFDTSAGGTFAEGLGVASDAQGNVYVTGDFQGTVVFDGPGGSDSQTSSNNSAFLTKYNANGTYAYTKTFDTSASSAFAIGFGVASDTQGNIYVSGQFQGTVVFDGPGGSDSRTSSNTSSFLTKYNANGSYAYTKTTDTSASGAQAYGTGVATDAQGNVYTTGIFDGTVIFDGLGGSDSQVDAGGNDNTFLTRYNANGTYGWTKSFDTSAGGGSSADARGVAITNLGYAYVTGFFMHTVIFDGPGGSDSRTSANENIFLTSFQVFIPNPPGSPASVPGAPNTGFGDSLTNPIRLLTFYGLASSSIAMLAVVSTKLIKRWSGR
jgi:hypothetical protein